MEKDFMTKLQDQGIIFSENGAIMNETSKSKLVDINFSIPSLRKLSLNHKFEALYEKFLGAYNENNEYALRWLLYSRDISGGIGERSIFRSMLIAIGRNNPDLLHKLLKLDLHSFGRYDDVISIYKQVDNESKNIIINKIKSQLEEDIKNIDTGHVSLLAKWMPSAQTSSKKQKRLAETFAKKMGMPIRNYRKMLSSLRSVIDLVESRMCKKDWENINYEHVPSKANIKYANAFIKHDYKRRNKYLEDVKDGKKSMNAKTAFPSDIVHMYCSQNGYIKYFDQAIENMWENQKFFEGFEDTLIVRDGSGSMTWNIPGSKMPCIEIADAITLYCCQNNKGQYANKFITFSSHPQIVDISNCSNLHDKLVTLRRYNDYSTTNIQATFDLILRTAIREHISQEELPKSVLVISDMEFDACNYRHKNDELFTEIGRHWEENGYTLPRLVFWNVNSRTNGIPINRHSTGTILLSGYSQNLLKMVMSSKTDPFEILIETLSNEKYDCVREIL